MTSSILSKAEESFLEKFGADKIWVNPSRDNVETILEINSFLRQQLTSAITEVLGRVRVEKYIGEGATLLQVQSGEIIYSPVSGFNAAVEEQNRLIEGILKELEV